MRKHLLRYFILLLPVITTGVKAQMVGTPHLSFYPVTARYGGTDQEYLYSINNTSDGGFIMGGYSASASAGSRDQTGSTSKGGLDYWIVKTDNTGNVQWQRRYGGSGNDQLYSVFQTSDGGYILSGRSEAGSALSGDQAAVPGKGGMDFWVIKTDASGNIQWQKRYGGAGDDMINGSNTIVQTNDGGYFMGGYTVESSSNTGDQTGSTNYGSYDYWVLKTDGNGNIQWQKRYGGSGEDYLYSVKQTTDGGYIIGGNSNISGTGSQAGQQGQPGVSSQGGFDYWIIKTNASGIIEWQKRYGALDGDFMYDVIQTQDNGYALAGHSDVGLNPLQGDQTGIQVTPGAELTNLWIIKTDSSGNMQWQKLYGGTGNDYCYALKQTADNGFIVGGFSDANSANTGDQAGAPGYGGNDYWVLKTDSAGSIQWQKRYGGAADDSLYSIAETGSGYIFGGFSAESSFNSGNQAGTDKQGGFDFWVIKTDRNGNIGIMR